MNPFLPSVFGRSPLQEEQYQQLYLQAVWKAIHRGRRPDTPASLPLDRLRDLVKKHGLESALLHPADLVSLFAGVSHAVYRATADLYCSHLGRSIPMVWKLLDAMARQTHVPSPSYEAIWACCLSLEQQRRDILTVQIERGREVWWLGQLALECLIRVNTWANTVMGCPLLCYVMEYSTGQVLAYGLASQETGEEQCALVLYEAILAARRPSSSASAGLLWHLPHRLVTACSLPWDCQKACRALLIAIEYQHELPAFAQAFPSDWAAHLAGRMLSSQQCLLLFDAYLAKHVPPSPLRVQEEQRRQYGHLLGYQRDAAWQFPLLRAFLPSRSATITIEGTLVYQGWHYQDPLLAYWPHALVTLRVPFASLPVIWVYLEREILCQAYAQERRSQAERYRALHPGR